MAKVRQAVVIVHGMGEQRPLDALNSFIDTALPGGEVPQPGDGKASPDGDSAPRYWSRPDRITDSYESRTYLAPRLVRDGQEVYAQTEFFEYHWAHLMQGNRLDDMFPTFRRILLTWPWRVPSGLRVVWVLFWALLGWGVWRLLLGPGTRLDLANVDLEAVVRVLTGGGLLGVALTYVVARLLPRWISTSFVDVVRYLDTTPRSYQVRKDIRRGMVNLLQGLHASGRYDRIVIVAHSLGSYIAYDAISWLWADMSRRRPGQPDPGEFAAAVAAAERAAQGVIDANPQPAALAAWQAAQRRLWQTHREQSGEWLITDFVSVGSPMYFADRLYTGSRRVFDQRVGRWEVPTCPPQSEGAEYNNVNGTRRWFSWPEPGTGQRILYHGAPFALVRWTNLWFPARMGFFGDWFGGPLGPLFGHGIADIEVTAPDVKGHIPGYAHACYFKYPGRPGGPDGVTRRLHEAMDLASTAWVAPSEETA